MTGLLIKLIVCPLVVFLVSFNSVLISYQNFSQPIIVGLVIAVFAHFMELYLLRKGSLWISTIVDFAAAAFLVYYLTLLMPGASVTWAGALLTALFLAITEVIQHYWLIRNEKTVKSK